MTLIKRILLAAGIVLSSLCTTLAQNKPLKADAFNTTLKSTAHAQLLDVRTPDEFSKGHLEGATNINWNDRTFSDKVATLDKEKPLFVYCLGGGRSAAAV